MKTTRAFTLVELLVVIAIISILAALLLPTMEDAMESARIAACQGNQKQMHIALSAYSCDADDRLPVKTWYQNWTYSGPDNFRSILYSSEGAKEDLSLYYWVRNYCEVQVNPWTAAGYGNANYFFTKDPSRSRGIFQCPSSKLVRDGVSLENYQYLVDYFASFTPTLISCGWQSSYTPQEQYFGGRFSRAAEPASGFEKAFFFDNLWSNNLGVAGAYNCHRPGENGGQNVCSGSGAVRWHPHTRLSTGMFGHPNTRVPKDYWAAVTYTAASSVSTVCPSISVFDPTRLSLWPGYEIDPVYTRSSGDMSSSSMTRKFNQYVKMWR